MVVVVWNMRDEARVAAYNLSSLCNVYLPNLVGFRKSARRLNNGPDNSAKP